MVGLVRVENGGRGCVKAWREGGGGGGEHRNIGITGSRKFIGSERGYLLN